MKRVNFHITDKQLKTLRKYAQKTGLTVAELLRRAIDEFLKTK